MSPHTADAHRWIDHDNVVLIVIVEVIHDRTHVVEGVPLVIEREHPSSAHVVNIRPHGLQRDFSLAVVVHHLCDLEDIPVPIAAVVILEWQLALSRWEEGIRN